ncbi:MAG: hypothetical protein HGA33_00765 [Candidatus Moranbacteria bacterium]|nr:hypothetical protein [Candidatus Moranbacteria bacterium]
MCIIGKTVLGNIAVYGELREEDAAKIERILGEYALLDSKLRALQALGLVGYEEWKTIEEIHMDPSIDQVQITEDGDSVAPLLEGGRLYNVAKGGKVAAEYLISNAERRSMAVTIYTKYGEFKLEEILGKHGCYASHAYPTYLRFGILEEAVIELLQVLRTYGCFRAEGTHR